MKVRFAAEAAQELEDAVAFYEGRSEGLGARFERVVRHLVEQIASFPLRYRVIENGVRRGLVTGFPYGVLFSIETEEILVLTVMHCHRRPGYWHGRTSGGKRQS